MKPDIIVTWPRSCDYPLWREYIRKNRTRFNEIIIVFMETNQGQDYRDFVREAMFPDRALCLESPIVQPGQDWRNVAVNAGLEHSLHSEWIWFTEQDFFPVKGFWEEVEKHTNDDFIGIKEGDRLHPACLFIRREILKSTCYDFGIVAGKLDHFGRIQHDLRENNRAILSPNLYIHMAGLSHNLSLIERGEAPNHKVVQLHSYLEGCLKVSVPTDPRFNKMITDYLETIKS